MRSIYNNMWNDALEAFEKDRLEFDPNIEDPNDQRRGITLQAKPDKNVLKTFKVFLEEAQIIEPEQYFYKPEEIHVTILSIINCFAEFSLPKINLPGYISCIESSLRNTGPFEIEFRGITASSSCILIQGFPGNNFLEIIRNNLREEFRKGNLNNSIDLRYQIKTAHCTVIRFKSQLRDKKNFITFLKMNRNNYFGKAFINELELVYTDWYHKKDVVQTLHRFKLKDKNN